jgi:OmpA-OmpF porin, OOP family
MSVTRFLAAAVVALSGLITASQASAQAQQSAAGFYVGGSLGQSNFDKDIVSGLIASGRVDTSDTGYKFFGGYQFNRNVGLEVAYVDLGKASYSGSYVDNGQTVIVTDGKVEVTGFNLSAVGAWPVSPNFDVFGKIGFLAWEDKASDISGGIPFSDTIDGTDLSFGFGANWHLTKNVRFRLEWERFRVDKTDADLFSIGAVYKF